MHPGGVDTWKDHWENKERKYDPPKGRWPANLILNHLEGCGANWVCVEGCPVRSLDEQSGVLSSGVGAVKKMSSATNRGNQGAAYGAENRPEGTPMVSYGDKGGASRFFKQVGGKVRWVSNSPIFGMAAMTVSIGSCLLLSSLSRCSVTCA